MNPPTITELRATLEQRRSLNYSSTYKRKRGSKNWVENFWNYTRITPGCWEWQAGKNFHGYGVLSKLGKGNLSHRLSCEIAGKPIPDGVFARHRCDNPGCVNPEHIVPGTPAQNLEDMRNRGRHENSNKTHCPKGHEYTPENTYLLPRGKGRECRICKTESRKRSLIKKSSE